MTMYETLAKAMDAGDELAEAEIRYRLLAETFEVVPNLRANLNPQLERAKAEILRLRVVASSKPGASSAKKPGTVVAFDPTRFHKSGT